MPSLSLSKKKIVKYNIFITFLIFNQHLKAQSAKFTILHGFNLAFEYWQSAKERRKGKRGKWRVEEGMSVAVTGGGKEIIK